MTRVAGRLTDSDGMGLTAVCFLSFHASGAWNRVSFKCPSLACQRSFSVLQRQHMRFCNTFLPCLRQLRGCNAVRTMTLNSGFNLPAECTVGSALDGAVSLFESNCIPEAQASAEFLLSAVTNSSRGRLRSQGTVLSLSSAERETFLGYVRKRLNRVPVQYIVGSWPFHNLEKDLILRPPTLIPRPETEELVERILQAYRDEGRAPRRFLEVGPGVRPRFPPRKRPCEPAPFRRASSIRTSRKRTARESRISSSRLAPPA